MSTNCYNKLIDNQSLLLLPFPMFRSLRPLPTKARLLIASRSLFSLLHKKCAKLSCSFSYPCALFKKEYFCNSFPINGFRTLLQNTGGGTLPEEASSVSCTASQKRALARPFLVALVAPSQPTENATPSNPASANLDAASSISPLLATLTKKHRGWGYPPSVHRSKPNLPCSFPTLAARHRTRITVHVVSQLAPTLPSHAQFACSILSLSVTRKAPCGE
jgi:hypothetical protein